MVSRFNRDVSRSGTGGSPIGVRFYSDKRANMIESQFDEITQSRGMELTYMPRTLNNVDEILGDALYPTYEENKVLKLKMKAVTDSGYEGQEFFAVTGRQYNHKIKFDITKARFKHEAETQKNLTDLIPRVGDLVLIETNDDLFEVTNIDPEITFYTHGKAFVYRIHLNKYKHAGAEMQTGIDKVDEITDIDRQSPLGPKLGDNPLLDRAVFDEVDPIVEEDFMGDY